MRRWDVRKAGNNKYENNASHGVFINKLILCFILAKKDFRDNATDSSEMHTIITLATSDKGIKSEIVVEIKAVANNPLMQIIEK